MSTFMAPEEHRARLRTNQIRARRVEVGMRVFFVHDFLEVAEVHHVGRVVRLTFANGEEAGYGPAEPVLLEPEQPTADEDRAGRFS